MSLVYTRPRSDEVGSRRASIYIGGRSDAKSLEKLQRWGISRILNVTPAKETSIQAGVPNFFEKTHSFVYKRIPVYDSPTSVRQLESQAKEIVSFIANGLFHGSVLVHCQHGVSRSTTCVVLYLMSKVHLSLKDAMKMIHLRRPEAHPIPAFLQLLERFEEKYQQDGGEASSKKRKTIGPARGPVRGPAIGPNIGPCIGPTDASESTSSSKKTKLGGVNHTTHVSDRKASIGPTLPSQRDTSQTTESPTIKGATVQIGPELPSKE